MVHLVSKNRAYSDGEVRQPEKLFVVISWQPLLATQDRSKGYNGSTLSEHHCLVSELILQPDITTPHTEQVVGYLLEQSSHERTRIYY